MGGKESKIAGNDERSSEAGLDLGDVDFNGTLNNLNNVVGIFIQGNDFPNGMNLGMGTSSNNNFSGIAPMSGSQAFNFNNGGAIIGNIQANGLIFTP